MKWKSVHSVMPCLHGGSERYSWQTIPFFYLFFCPLSLKGPPIRYLPYTLDNRRWARATRCHGEGLVLHWRGLCNRHNTMGHGGGPSSCGRNSSFETVTMASAPALKASATLPQMFKKKHRQSLWHLRTQWHPVDC